MTALLPDGAVTALRRMSDERCESAMHAHTLGVPVVGTIGASIPADLIRSLGYAVVEVVPVDGPAGPLDALIEPEAPTARRALFSALVRGDWSFLDLLVIDRSAAALFHHLSEVVRTGRATAVPPLWMLDVVPESRSTPSRYNLAQVRRLTERLGGGSLTPDAAGASGLDGSDALRREMQAARRTGRLHGSDSFWAAMARTTVERDAWSSATNDLLRARPSAADPPVTRLGLVAARPVRDPALFHAVERAGADVVWEDSACELWRPAIEWTPDPIAAAADWAQTVAAPRYGHPFEFRNAEVLALTRDRVDGVLVHMPPSDAVLGWDVPRLREMLSSRGMPSAVLECEDHVISDEAVATAISELS